MKTLIFNGSTRKNGDTEALINEFAAHLNGEVKIVSHNDNISPCIDCRYCHTNAGCAINDDMQKVYKFLKECDNIVLASPVWFKSLSGPLINICSRVQELYAAKFFRGEPDSKIKQGVIILVSGVQGMEEVPEKTALNLMKFMNVDISSVEKIYSFNTSSMPAKDDKIALEKCSEVADKLNNLGETR